MDSRKNAIIKLTGFTDGLIEYPLWLDDSVLFTPDVSCLQDGKLSNIYQVIDSKGITGKELGLIQYYSYRTGIALTVFEVNTNYILNLIKRPLFIKTEARYIIDPFYIEDSFLSKEQFDALGISTNHMVNRH